MNYFSLQSYRSAASRYCNYSGAPVSYILMAEYLDYPDGDTITCQVWNGKSYETINVTPPQILRKESSRGTLTYTYYDGTQDDYYYHQNRIQTDASAVTCREKITPFFIVGEKLIVVATFRYEKSLMTDGSYSYSLVESWVLLDGRTWAEVPSDNKYADYSNTDGNYLQQSIDSKNTFYRASLGDVIGGFQDADYYELGHQSEQYPGTSGDEQVHWDDGDVDFMTIGGYGGRGLEWDECMQKKLVTHSSVDCDLALYRRQDIEGRYFRKAGVMVLDAIGVNDLGLDPSDTFAGCTKASLTFSLPGTFKDGDGRYDRWTIIKVDSVNFKQIKFSNVSLIPGEFTGTNCLLTPDVGNVGTLFRTNSPQQTHGRYGWTIENNTENTIDVVTSGHLFEGIYPDDYIKVGDYMRLSRGGVSDKRKPEDEPEKESSYPSNHICVKCLPKNEMITDYLQMAHPIMNGNPRIAISSPNWTANYPVGTEVLLYDQQDSYNQTGYLKTIVDSEEYDGDFDPNDLTHEFVNNTEFYILPYSAGIDNGTVTGGGGLYLFDDSKSWADDSMNGKFVRFKEYPEYFQIIDTYDGTKLLLSNTAQTISGKDIWPGDRMSLGAGYIIANARPDYDGEDPSTVKYSIRYSDVVSGGTITRVTSDSYWGAGLQYSMLFTRDKAFVHVIESSTDYTLNVYDNLDDLTRYFMVLNSPVFSNNILSVDNYARIQKQRQILDITDFDQTIEMTGAGNYSVKLDYDVFTTCIQGNISPIIYFILDGWNVEPEDPLHFPIDMVLLTVDYDYDTGV